MSSGPTLLESQREGWARGVVNQLFPNLHSGRQFTNDINFIYQWEEGAKHGTRNDPLNLRRGDYADRHTAAVASAHWIEHHPKLFAALKKGDMNAARSSLHDAVNVTPSRSKLPGPIDKHGTFSPTDVPSTWDEITGTIGGMPGEAGKDLAGVGDFLGKHMVLIIVALIAVVMIAGKK